MEARLNYLDYVQDWPVYGVTYFEVQQRQFRLSQSSAIGHYV